MLRRLNKLLTTIWRGRDKRGSRRTAVGVLMLPLLLVGVALWQIFTSIGGGMNGTATQATLSASVIATAGNINESGFAAEAERKPRRPPGRHVFVDVGANCGNSYWKLKNDPNNGVLDSDDWETHLWECNPQMNRFFLRELAESDPSIHLIEKAASTENGSVSFYLTKGQENIQDKSQFSERGVCDPKSSYSPSGASTMYGNAKRAGNEITVESANFVEWFDNLLVRIKSTNNVATVNGNENNRAKVVLKIDVEGAEKEVLEAMVRADASGAICQINKLWMEYHYGIFKEGTDEYNTHLKFKDDFPVNFEKKCGRKLDIGGWH